MAAPHPASQPALAPPKNDTFTLESLKQFDGEDPSRAVYVAVKGTVFDVSAKRDMYGKGGSYHVFAGKDGSRGLGLSSVKAEDAVPDYSSLNADQLKVLDQWFTFFSTRYNVVGRVV